MSLNFIQFTELREARQLGEDQTSGGTKKSRFFWFQRWELSPVLYPAHIGCDKLKTSCKNSSMPVLMPFAIWLRNGIYFFTPWIWLDHVTLANATLVIITQEEALKSTGALELNTKPQDHHGNEPVLASWRWTEAPQQTACQLPDMWVRPSKITKPQLTAATSVSLGKTRTAQLIPDQIAKS